MLCPQCQFFTVVSKCHRISLFFKVLYRSQTVQYCDNTTLDCKVLSVVSFPPHQEVKLYSSYGKGGAKHNLHKVTAKPVRQTPLGCIKAFGVKQPSCQTLHFQVSELLQNTALKNKSKLQVPLIRSLSSLWGGYWVCCEHFSYFQWLNLH